MARLVYSTIASLDGYVADADGNFDWAAPDEEVHAFVNELERPVGTYLYGRRMYEVMTLLGGGWTPDPSRRSCATSPRSGARPTRSSTRARWRKCRARGRGSSGSLIPDAVRGLVATASSDVGIGGPELAAEALRAGLVDECQVFLAPVVVGAGKRSLPDGVFARLELLEQRRFESGFVYLRYGVRR